MVKLFRDVLVVNSRGCDVCEDQVLLKTMRCYRTWESPHVKKIWSCLVLTEWFHLRKMTAQSKIGSNPV